MFPFAEEQAALCRDRLVIRSVKPMENKECAGNEDLDGEEEKRRKRE